MSRRPVVAASSSGRLSTRYVAAEAAAWKSARARALLDAIALVMSLRGDHSATVCIRGKHSEPCANARASISRVSIFYRLRRESGQAHSCEVARTGWRARSFDVATRA